MHFTFAVEYQLLYSLQTEIDPGEISLMNAGACGAFVHGLEDEFMGETALAQLEPQVNYW